MKRYRVLQMDFNTSATLLALKVEDHWDEQVKQLHLANKARILQNLSEELGPKGIERKAQNLIDVGAKPFSIVAFHNRFLSQIRTAFIIGAYYPALVGACALGERILNHLILRLRKDFRTSPRYKKIYRKKSFDDWQLAIDTLEEWDVLTADTISNYRSLARLRNRTIHFEPATDTDDRALALKGIRLLSEIVGDQFSAFGPQPWFIPDMPGETYVRRDAEPLPFVRRVVIPNCAKVGPYHQLTTLVPRVEFVDEEYPDRQITDDEFRAMRAEGRAAASEKDQEKANAHSDS